MCKSKTYRSNDKHKIYDFIVDFLYIKDKFDLFT